MKKSVSSFKKVICMVLVALTLVGSTVVPGTQFFSTTAKADYDCIEYYPRYTGSSNSLVDALKSLGIDSSFSHRTQIAALNGYSNYSGTATQNSSLLSKLKKGVLIRSVTRVSDTSAWEIDMASSVSLRVGETKTITIRFRGMGISSVGGSYTGSSYISASFANVNWQSSGGWCSAQLVIIGKSAGSSTLTFKLNGTNPTSRSMTVTVSGTSSSLVQTNLSRVGFIKQTTNACKSSSVAMALRLITGSNSYTSAGLGGGYCVGIGGNIYTGSDGNRYRAVYRQDTYRGSYNELIGEIDRSLSAGVPIVVPVHRTNGGTDHHWVVIVGKNGGDYLILDPASGNSGTIMSGNTKTLSSAKYALGIANQGYAGWFYGYVSFSRI